MELLMVELGGCEEEEEFVDVEEGAEGIRA